MSGSILDFDVDFCAAYIVKAGKEFSNEKDETINEIGQRLQLVQGSIFELNQDIGAYFLPLYANSIDTCRTDVTFKLEGGSQFNKIRDLVRTVAFADQQEKENAARKLALGLSLATDRRSPDGLFVVMCGSKENLTRIAIFKFPADELIQANFGNSGLNIAVVEGAFSKKTDYFKAAVFEGTNATTSMWEGKVEDRQASQSIYEVSEYWVQRFLTCIPSLKPAKATSILANNIKDLIKHTTDPDLQADIVSGAIFLRSQTERPLTMRKIAEDYIPRQLQERFLRSLPDPSIADAVFTLDSTVYRKQVGVRVITLDNQISVAGPISAFENTNKVQIEQLSDSQNTARITLTGQKTGERVRSV